MAKQKGWYRFLSILNAWALIFQQLLFPFSLAVSARPVVAASARVAEFSFEFLAKENSFLVRIPTQDRVEYGLYYLRDEGVTEAVAGSEQNNDGVEKEIKAATCSKDVCVNHQVKRGVFKWQSPSHTGGLAFVVVDQEMSIVSRYEISELGLTPEEEMWLSGADVSPPGEIKSVEQPKEEVKSEMKVAPQVETKALVGLSGVPMLANDPADDYSLASVTGVWTSVSGGSNITGINTNEIRWGVPAGSQKSGLRFDGSGTQSFNADESFYLGALTHMNWPTKNGAADGARLKIELSFANPTVSPNPDFSFDFDINETVNQDWWWQCPSFQKSHVPCDDRITFPVSYGSKSFQIGDKLYTLKIDGFVSSYPSGTPVSEFITEEEKNNVAYLVGSLSSVLVAAPQITLVEKAVNGEDADVVTGPVVIVGSPVNFSYIVQNTGNVDMNNVAVHDSDASLVISCPKSILAAGESMTCIASGVAQAGQYENTAYVTSEYGAASYISNNELAHYFGDVSCHAGQHTLEGQVYGNGYTTGNLCQGGGDCWAEGDNVPARLTITGLDVGVANSVVIEHDYQQSGYTGYESFNTPTSSNDTATGISLSTPTTVDCGSGTTCQQYTLSFTPTASTVQLDWNALLSDTAADWPGASLHYRLISGACGGAGNKDISISPNQLTVLGSITPIKSSDNGANPTDWSFNITGNTNVSGVTSGTTVGDLALGTNNADASYTITEVGPAGWALESVSGDCTYLSSNSATVTLSKDDPDVSCTFVNQQQKGSLIVQKTTLPVGDQTSFAINLSGTGTVTGGGSGSVSDAIDQSYEVTPGTYSVTESVPTGWGLTSNGCTNITVNAGETKYCTLENKKLPVLTVEKVIVGEQVPYTNFSFVLDGWSTNQFEEDGNNDIYIVPDQAYTITEADPGSQYNVSYSAGCTGTLIYNQTATCTITNTKYGSLTIIKDANPISTQPFGFTTTGTGLTNFSLTDNGSVFGDETKTFSNLLPGTYSVAETGVTGWDLTGATCSDGSSNTAIDLSAGENVTCTFTNVMRGAIGGHKYNDSDGDILTTSDRSPVEGWTIELYQDGVLKGSTTTSSAGTYGFSNLVPGTYALQEVLQIGWIKLHPSTISLTVVLDPGENDFGNDFINAQYASITVYKDVDTDADGDIDVSHASDWIWNINGAGDYATGTTVSTVVPGTHVISEEPQTGYHVTSLVCNNGIISTNDYGAVESQSIALASGQDLVCTFTNTKDVGTLRVMKDLVNDNGGTLDESDFSFKVNDGSNVSFEADGTNDFVVPIGAYSVVENEATGYATTYNGCTNAVVTVGGITTCTITNDDIAPALTLVKTVTNDNGGTAVATDWTLTATGPTSISGAGGVVSDTTFDAGTYTLSETGLTGYSAGSWSCVGGTQNGSSITLGLGESATCTINNDDNAPALHLRKIVTNDNGGSAVDTNWTLSATGTGLSATNLSGTTPVDSGADFKADTYTLSETGGPSGYVAGSWSCVGGTQNGDQISVALGEDVTCTITNDDQQAHLTLVKSIVNNNGGNDAANSWTLSANGPTPITGTTGTAAVTNVAVNAGTYTLSESGPSAYESSDWVCVGGSQVGNQITLANDQSATCTITNDDITPTLTVIKNVINDNGGILEASDFGIKLGDDLLSFGNAVINGSTSTYTATPTVTANTPYTLSENDLSGYIEGTWNCVDVATGQAVALPFSLNEGQNVSCSITNDDIAPTITLIKSVINNNGGQAGENDFGLSIGGTAVNSNQTISVNAHQNYSLNEVGLTGYSFVSLTGTGCPSVLDGTVNLSEGQNVTCTITNDDIAPQLHLRKTVTNDNGGSELEMAWTLTATGTGDTPTNLSGTTPVDSDSAFRADTYALAESGPSGYTSGTWDCGRATMPDATHVVVPFGGNVTCTINNDDNVPSLTLNKILINDDGGSASESDWTLTANGGYAGTLSGPGAADNNDVVSGADFKVGTYVLSESAGPNGYTSSSWTCVKNGGAPVIGNVITLDLDDTAVCTVTNDDIAPTLKLTKIVSGGDKTAADWTLSATGIGGFSDLGNSEVFHQVRAGETYILSESTIPGYTGSWWTCDGGQASGNTVLLGLADQVTCSITNTRDTGNITIVKNAVGGDETFNFESNFGVSSIITTEGTGTQTVSGLVTGNTYYISESGIEGWDLNSAVCDHGTIDAIEIVKDATTTCTFTNTKRGLVTVYKFEDGNSNGVRDNGEALLPNWEITLGDTTQSTDVTGSTQYSVVPGDYSLSETLQDGWVQTGMYCDQGGTKITAEGEAYGHHGNCGGWNDCGDAATCAQWACEVAGYSDLVSYGAEKPCTEFGNCNLFYSRGNVQYNWGNWCPVMGVTDIVCGNGSSSGDNELLYRSTDHTVVVDPGDEGSCYVGNFQKGDVTVWKYEDTDGVLGRSEDEVWIGSPTFDFRLYKNTGDAWQLLGQQSTNSEGKAEFTNLLNSTGSYYVCEVKKNGWEEMRSLNNPANNLSGATDEYPVCEGISVSSSNYSVGVEFGNARYSSIHGYKWNDIDGDSQRDETESLLAGWTVNLYRWNGEAYDNEPVRSMVTADSNSEHFGWYWFEDLLPGQYKVCEVDQTGWNQTFPMNNDDDCHLLSLPSGTSNGFSFPEMLNAIGGPVYAFGNQYVEPELTIEKYNNRWPNVLSPNDEVIYTIVVKALKNTVYNVKVHDLLPLDIKYKAGSYKAVSSVNGVLAISEPTYASPGVWTLPTIEAGEVITLSYLGKVQDGTDPGTYKDVAWASGTIGANDSTQVMARAGSEGYLANAFVGTSVLVDRSLQSSADVNVIEEKKQGKVLGATTLPATGANTAWLIGSLILIGAGAGLMLVSGKKRGKKCVN